MSQVDRFQFKFSVFTVKAFIRLQVLVLELHIGVKLLTFHGFKTFRLVTWWFIFERVSIKTSKINNSSCDSSDLVFSFNLYGTRSLLHLLDLLAASTWCEIRGDHHGAQCLFNSRSNLHAGRWLFLIILILSLFFICNCCLIWVLCHSFRGCFSLIKSNINFLLIVLNLSKLPFFLNQLNELRILNFILFGILFFHIKFIRICRFKLFLCTFLLRIKSLSRYLVTWRSCWSHCRR